MTPFNDKCSFFYLDYLFSLSICRSIKQYIPWGTQSYFALLSGWFAYQWTSRAILDWMTTSIYLICSFVNLTRNVRNIIYCSSYFSKKIKNYPLDLNNNFFAQKESNSTGKMTYICSRLAYDRSNWQHSITLRWKFRKDNTDLVLQQLSLKI